MTNKQKFIEEVFNVFSKEGGPTLSKESWDFFNNLKEEKASAGVLTEMGERVLLWVRDNTQPKNPLFSSKVIGEGLFLSPRIVSGAARKLINDGYLYKEGKNPVYYGITEAGAEILEEAK